MGRDSKRTCQKCQHVSPSVRRHKDHCRGHYLLFVCPCRSHSHTKEVTRKHQLRAEKRGDNNSCTRGTLYTVDEKSFEAWKKATKVALPSYPQPKPAKKTHKPNPRHQQKQPEDLRAKLRPPVTEVRRVTTPPRPDRSNRAIVGYKQPSMTVYNSRTINKEVPSQMVVGPQPSSSPKKWRKLLSRGLYTMRSMRGDIIHQQHELDKLKRTLDQTIQMYDEGLK